ncbi:hypothetical protein GCM10011504_26780 [Siccirubricoccus deserti]|uniref:Uncharacterized protein n=1 Tax=Siccirubricoccus deserti TaxID=2013562 RepID=A0A9X0UE17_9PROT|nr:hypothetical protein [Siccirubricoccus deserti]MBC4016316.1 hypothetical protein [Siccirubricoccus deserti]GGC46962.1 hypothetical protein GCM10011504_26780 [Siccirubricoccus deserti]
MTARSNRIVISAREQADAEMAAIFAASDDPALRALAERMVRCQQSRAEKSRWRDLRDVIRVGWGYQCKTVACSACRRAHHIREWQVRVHDRFVDADNEDCSLVTVHLARVGDLNDIREVVAGARRAFRDLRDRQARQRHRWRSVEVAGVVEVDAMASGDVPLLLSDRAAMLPCLPMVGAAGPVVWLPHLHAAVHHPDVDRAELRAALEARWEGPHRVDVREFHSDKLAGENAADINGYASKFDACTNTDGIEEPWPVSWRAEWWGWLHSLRRGLEPMRVSFKPMKAVVPLHVVRCVEVEPMPFIIA